VPSREAISPQEYPEPAQALDGGAGGYAHASLDEKRAAMRLLSDRLA
jgi:hypothetical protein